MASRKIQVEIVGDSRSVERAFKKASKAGSGFDRAMRGLAFGGVAALGTAFVGVGLALRRGFREVSESQKVLAQTNAVIKSTGHIAGVTAKDVDRLSKSLAKKSGIDDEAITSAQNLLLTFTNIRGRELFGDVTAAALDMSVALGKDVFDASMMIGKAMNDLNVTSMGTVRGWSVLRRSGVNVSKELMEQGAAFIKAGKPMQAQRLLLAELNKEFGGSAKAFGSTLPGAMGKLNVAIDEITGAFVQGLAPVIQTVATSLNNKLANPQFVARVREIGTLVGTKLLAAFRAISTWFSAHWGDIRAGFVTFANIMRGTKKVALDLKSAVVTITTPLRIQLKILLAIWDKILAAVSFGAGLMSKLPIFGDKFKGIREAVDAARTAIADPLGRKAAKRDRRIRKNGNLTGNFDDRRARGGPVRAGMSYLVGERGPEIFVPGMNGGIVPNGGGGRGGDLIINLDGREIGRVALSHITRTSKRTAGQSRGRYGGQNLALG